MRSTRCKYDTFLFEFGICFRQVFKSIASKQKKTSNRYLFIYLKATTDVVVLNIQNKNKQ